MQEITNTVPHPVNDENCRPINNIPTPRNPQIQALQMSEDVDALKLMHK